MHGWTDQDFHDVFAFLGEMRELLRDSPTSIVEHAEIIKQDLETASSAFCRIHDAVCV